MILFDLFIEFFGKRNGWGREKDVYDDFDSFWEDQKYKLKYKPRQKNDYRKNFSRKHRSDRKNEPDYW